MAARQAAAAAQGKKVFGRQPIGPDRDRDVIRTRQQAAKARAAAGATAAALASVPAPDSAAKVNTTDWASRVMPLKKGGFDQLVNAQALATERSQVILAIIRHDNPADTGALHPLLAMARAVLDAAGIAGPIAKAVFDAGYASDANFTADASRPSCTSPWPARACRPGAAATGASPSPRCPAGRTWPPGWTPPMAGPSTRSAPPPSSRSSPSSPAGSAAA